MRAQLAGLAWCAATLCGPPALANPGGPDAPFHAADVLGGTLSVTRDDGAGERVQSYTFTRGATRPAAALLDALGGAVGGAVPASGMRRCGLPSEPGRAPAYLMLELRIALKDRAALRLRAESLCAQLLPWNITDGKQLFLLTGQAAGAAVVGLVQALCGACLPPLALPAPAPAAPDAGAGFDQQYQRLLAEWQRLDGRGPTEIKIETAALIDALAWMDRARFERQLRRSARQGGAVGALAHDVARLLPVTHPDAN